MTYEQDLEAVLDEKSVRLEGERVVVALVVNGRLHKQYVFEVTWRRGHESDWSWQDSTTWLQTELNAELLGIEPAALIALTTNAITNFSMTMNTSVWK